MHQLSKTRGIRLAALALVILAASAGTAVGQSGPYIGIIPGTSMSRDEFNARARAQLAALALNAVAYLIAGDAYDEDYYDLQASPAGNLGLKNMFTGRPVQAIMFDAPVDALINTPVAGLPGAFDELNPNAPSRPMGPMKPVDPESGSSDWQFIPATSSPAPLRVDPARIRDFSGGDIYYYVRDELLQLVMFAPDGSYFERVDEIPNPNYRENMQLATGAAPESLYVAQVLYYLGNLAPQYSNLVRYMSNRETIPGAMFPTLGATERMEMSKEIGVTVRNPITRQPIKVSSTPSPGDIVDGAVSGGQLKLWDANGKAVSRADLTVGAVNREQGAPRPAKPVKPKAGNKPGKGGGAAPGGGRQPR